MNSTKRVLTLVLCIAFMLSTLYVCVQPANAAKPCKHKYTYTKYKYNNSNNHYKIVTCQNCKRQISKTKQYHSYPPYRVTKIYKKFHIKSTTCRCGEGIDIGEDHWYKKKSKKCAVCGYKKK